MAEDKITRILVFSDTHGRTEGALKAIADSGDIDMVFHLGDNVRDAERIACVTGVETIAVRGNCDYTPDDARRVVSVCGQKILLTHGHDLAVGFSLMRLALAAEEAGADAALFGHTHKPQMEYHNGILLLNPGSISQPRCPKRTYALLEVSGDGIRAKLIEA